MISFLYACIPHHLFDSISTGCGSFVHYWERYMNNRLNRFVWMAVLIGLFCSSVALHAHPCAIMFFMSLICPLRSCFKRYMSWDLLTFWLMPFLNASQLFFPQQLDHSVLKFCVFFVWVCCHSRWKSSRCWSSQSTETQFSNNREFFCAKTWLLSWRTQPLPRSPCILHQGLRWINNAFVLGVQSEKRESNRLELWCGISEQLLHEWQSQGLLIWTWENPGGAGGEETAAAAEPLCTAVCGVRQPSL